MAKVRQFAVKTAIDADGDQKQTNVTVEFDCSPERLEELAARSAIITAQGSWRRAGAIPSAATIKLSAVGSRGGIAPMTPETVEARAAADPEFRKAMLAKLEVLKAMK